MPIYAYRCRSCNHEKEILQKVADVRLTRCPTCGKDTFFKQITAAGFQLKGTGWYVTDFRDSGASKSAQKKKEAESSEAKTSTYGDAGGKVASADKTAASPAPAAKSS